MIGIITLRRKLYTLMMPEGEDVEDHLRTMRETRSELRSLADKVEDRDFCLAVLTSLPASWDSFIRSIDPEDLVGSSTLAAKITPNKLMARIMQEANRATARDGEPDTALATADTICYRCGKRGHIARDCRHSARTGTRHSEHPRETRRGREAPARGSRPHSSRRHSSDRSDGSSSEDETVGYVAWMAYDPRNSDSEPASSDSGNSDEEGSSLTNGMAADSWYLDSGATIHSPAIGAISATITRPQAQQFTASAVY